MGHHTEMEQQNTEYYPAFMNNERVFLSKELEYLKQLWLTHNERLHSLEITSAKKGIDTDPSMQTEIVSIKCEMTNITERCCEISYKLERLTRKAIYP